MYFFYFKFSLRVYTGTRVPGTYKIILKIQLKPKGFSHNYNTVEV
jgi:hypothetical protein